MAALSLHSGMTRPPPTPALRGSFISPGSSTHTKLSDRPDRRPLPGLDLNPAAANPTRDRDPPPGHTAEPQKHPSKPKTPKQAKNTQASRRRAARPCRADMGRRGFTHAKPPNPKNIQASQKHPSKPKARSEAMPSGHAERTWVGAASPTQSRRTPKTSKQAENTQASRKRAARPCRAEMGGRGFAATGPH